MLDVRNLTVSVDGKTILKNLSFLFEKGKTYAIMGPNGSGKSTLAGAIMGNPVFTLSENSQLILDKKNITELETNERAQKGIFMSFQSPIALTGVTIFQLLRFALQGAKDPLEIRQAVQKHAKALQISEDLLSRSLNDGFSGGERKKMEVLQAAVLEPSVMVFDEIDTGVDVDALKSIAATMRKLATKDRVTIVITHYNRILKYLKPDVVLVLKDGEINKVGDHTLAEKIELEGYEKIAA